MSEKKDPRFHFPYPLFDSHFHTMHMLERDAEAESIIDASLDAGLVGAIEVAVNELDFEKRLAFAAVRPPLGLSAGIHPSSVGPDHSSWERRFSIIRQQASDPMVMAVGETGLDFFRDHTPRENQERAFAEHLDLAADTGLPLIIHNRDADERILSLLSQSRCRRGVFHCFSSDWKTAKRALELGFYVSFAGNVTYKKAEHIREAASRVPLDRLLIETDSPYLSPMPVRGRNNHPGHLGYTLEAVSRCRVEDPAVLADATVRNARELFGMSDGSTSARAG